MWRGFTRSRGGKQRQVATLHLAHTTATPPAATCPGASAPAPPPSPATWRPPAFVTLPGQKSDIPWAEATLAAWTGGEVHTLGITVTGGDGIGCGGERRLRQLSRVAMEVSGCVERQPSVDRRWWKNVRRGSREAFTTSRGRCGGLAGESSCQ